MQDRKAVFLTSDPNPAHMPHFPLPPQVCLLGGERSHPDMNRNFFQIKHPWPRIVLLKLFRESPIVNILGFVGHLWLSVAYFLLFKNIPLINVKNHS